MRKGIAARDPDDMVEWDSIVGHHLGLTHAPETFLKTIKKRIDDEVFKVYRHGIMLGSVVNFDNVVVASKAWNLLFAIADWADATEKANKPAEPKPTLGSITSLLRETWSTQALRGPCFRLSVYSSVSTGKPVAMAIS